MRAENRELLHRLGTVVYLKVSAETVYKRLKGDATRPLLQGANPMKKIAGLLTSREKLYEEAADIAIVNDGKEYDKVIQEILEACG